MFIAVSEMSQVMAEPWYAQVLTVLGLFALAFVLVRIADKHDVPFFYGGSVISAGAGAYLLLHLLFA